MDISRTNKYVNDNLSNPQSNSIQIANESTEEFGVKRTTHRYTIINRTNRTRAAHQRTMRARPSELSKYQ